MTTISKFSIKFPDDSDFVCHQVKAEELAQHRFGRFVQDWRNELRKFRQLPTDQQAASLAQFIKELSEKTAVLPESYASGLIAAQARFQNVTRLDELQDIDQSLTAVLESAYKSDRLAIRLYYFSCDHLDSLQNYDELKASFEKFYAEFNQFDPLEMPLRESREITCVQNTQNDDWLKGEARNVYLLLLSNPQQGIKRLHKIFDRIFASFMVKKFADYFLQFVSQSKDYTSLLASWLPAFPETLQEILIEKLLAKLDIQNVALLAESLLRYKSLLAVRVILLSSDIERFSKVHSEMVKSVVSRSNFQSSVLLAESLLKEDHLRLVALVVQLVPGADSQVDAQDPQKLLIERIALISNPDTIGKLFEELFNAGREVLAYHLLARSHPENTVLLIQDLLEKRRFGILAKAASLNRGLEQRVVGLVQDSEGINPLMIGLLRDKNYQGITALTERLLKEGKLKLVADVMGMVSGNDTDQSSETPDEQKLLVQRVASIATPENLGDIFEQLLNARRERLALQIFASNPKCSELLLEKIWHDYRMDTVAKITTLNQKFADQVFMKVEKANAKILIPLIEGLVKEKNFDFAATLIPDIFDDGQRIPTIQMVARQLEHDLEGVKVFINNFIKAENPDNAAELILAMPNRKAAVQMLSELAQSKVHGDNECYECFVEHFQGAQEWIRYVMSENLVEMAAGIFLKNKDYEHLDQMLAMCNREQIAKVVTLAIARNAKLNFKHLKDLERKSVLLQQLIQLASGKKKPELVQHYKAIAVKLENEGKRQQQIMEEEELLAAMEKSRQVHRPQQESKAQPKQKAEEKKS